MIPSLPPLYRVEKLGYNKMRLSVPAGSLMLTRHQAFRLIGELERMGAGDHPLVRDMLQVAVTL